MKAMIKEELKEATYFVELTNGILYVDPRIVQTVINNLGATFQALTSGGISTEEEPRFPHPDTGFSSEPESYAPLVHLLNKIIHTAGQCTPSSSPLSNLHFHPFGFELEDVYDSHKCLKPDVVGITGELQLNEKMKRPELSWEAVEVHVKSQDSESRMVVQSGAYARCCFINNQRRSFSLGIGFHYKKLEVYILVYHRSGVSTSRPLKVTSREGFNNLVSHIVGILSIKDEAAYGLDTTRFQDIFRINDRYYKVIHLLHARKHLRGRSTIVHRLQGMYRCESRVYSFTYLSHTTQPPKKYLIVTWNLGC